MLPSGDNPCRIWYKERCPLNGGFTCDRLIINHQHTTSIIINDNECAMSSAWTYMKSYYVFSFFLFFTECNCSSNDAILGAVIGILIFIIILLIIYIVWQRRKGSQQFCMFYLVCYFVFCLLFQLILILSP